MHHLSRLSQRNYIQAAEGFRSSITAHSIRTLYDMANKISEDLTSAVLMLWMAGN
jgi:hypothetical protein